MLGCAESACRVWAPPLEVLSCKVPSSACDAWSFLQSRAARQAALRGKSPHSPLPCCCLRAFLLQQRALEMARGELGSSRSRLQLIEQELQVGGALWAHCISASWWKGREPLGRPHTCCGVACECVEICGAGCRRLLAWQLAAACKA